jgi:hypothetical protein
MRATVRAHRRQGFRPNRQPTCQIANVYIDPSHRTSGASLRAGTCSLRRALRTTKTTVAAASPPRIRRPEKNPHKPSPQPWLRWLSSFMAGRGISAIAMATNALDGIAFIARPPRTPQTPSSFVLQHRSVIAMRVGYCHPRSHARLFACASRNGFTNSGVGPFSKAGTPVGGGAVAGA